MDASKSYQFQLGPLDARETRSGRWHPHRWHTVGKTKKIQPTLGEQNELAHVGSFLEIHALLEADNLFCFAHSVRFAFWRRGGCSPYRRWWERCARVRVPSRVSRVSSFGAGVCKARGERVELENRWRPRINQLKACGLFNRDIWLLTEMFLPFSRKVGVWKRYREKKLTGTWV